MGKTAKLLRIQQLFARGEVVTIQGDDDERIPLFIAKPSSLEHDEAIKDGRGRRAQAMLAHDKDEVAQAEVKLAVFDRTDAEIVKDLLYETEMAHYDKARDEVRTDESWSERIEALERGALPDSTDEEVDTLLEIRKDYEAEVMRHKMALTNDQRDELLALSREELEKKWSEQYRSMVGGNAFREARRRTELWFAIRECQGTLDDDGKWQHPDCGAHREKFFDDRKEIHDLPDEVTAEIVEVLADLQMTQVEAGNLAAPSVSSGPLEQPSKAEDSTLSTPSET